MMFNPFLSDLTTLEMAVVTTGLETAVYNREWYNSKYGRHRSRWFH